MPEQYVSPSQQYLFAIVGTVLQTKDFEVAMEDKKFFVSFEWAFIMISPRLPMEERLSIEKEYWEMKRCEQLILKNEESETSREKFIGIIHADFAQRHRHALTRGLAKLGADIIQTAGTLNFDKSDIEIMTKVIRDHSGLNTAIKSVEEEHADDRPAGDIPTELPEPKADG